MGAIFAWVLLLLWAGAAGAVTEGFVENETGNSLDWEDAVAAMGGVVNADVDFDAHPVGPLQPDFYLASDGVELLPVDVLDTVVGGAGPGQANDHTPPVSPGEGPHDASNHLGIGSSELDGSLTVSFTEPVLGAGLFVIDLFSPASQPAFQNRVSIEAFSGPGGSGASLGRFDNAQFNFQPNHLYFMGVVSSDEDIRSLVFITEGRVSDRIAVDDIRFAAREVLPVEIQIGDGHGDGPSPVNPMSRGVLPVAVLGAADLDVAEVDRSSLAFGPHGATPAHRKGGHREEKSGDALTDLVSHYRIEETGIAFGDTEACVSGALADGRAFEGCAPIRTLPACGLGFELALLLPPLAWWRRRWG